MSSGSLASNSSVASTPSPEDAAKLEAQQAMMAYILSRFHTLQLFLLLGYGIMCLLCITLVIYLRHNRYTALRGDATAARKIILPAFEPLLWVLGCSTGLYTAFFCSALATKLYTYEISKLATEVFYSGRQFVFLSVIVFMLQKSVSGPALRRTLMITLVLSTYTIPLVWAITTYYPVSDLYVPLTAARALMLLLYSYVLIRPPARASKRTLREFCVFAYIYYALLFAYNECFRRGHLETGFYLTYSNLLCGSLCPLVIWRVLRADTEHWRGMGQRAVALQRLFCQTRGMPERVSSKGLHILIEMHRKFIIDFAYLELQQRIGVGASAVVFKGLLRSSTDVAVKVYTPTDFTEDTVAAFSQEAALCGALHHPNIVAFHGMCVCPPTICLVNELCVGSLEDVTCAAARRRSRAGEHDHNRQQLLLNVAYMLDAARAVAYLHSFRPPFLHRDIKPTNFLVDANSTVKLTDFGESRSLPRAQVVSNGLSNATATTHRSSAGGYGSEKASTVAMLASEDSTAKVPAERASIEIAVVGAANLQQLRGSIGAKINNKDGNRISIDANAVRMTVKGTVDYMAPEVINGRAGLAAYGEAADVYSLGITMWDVLNPGKEKFPDTGSNHFRVFDLVLEGQRPDLDVRVHPSIRAIIESSWQHDPRLRPSAHSVVSTLESIQEELSAAFALELADELEDAMRLAKPIDASSAPLVAPQGFSGEEAISHMRQFQYVDNTSEAVRLGNALMDSGLLHHSKHARPFEESEEVYFFDDDNINLCQPLMVGAYTHGHKAKVDAESATVISSSTRPSQRASHRSGSTNPYTNSARVRSDSSQSQSDRTLLENGICACRKLGQRLKLPKTSKTRHRFRRKAKGKGKPSPAMVASDAAEQLQTRLLLESPHDNSEFDGFDASPTVA
ncbi:hypothetical protein PR003_g22829 [Phytophthora rubi]|uniref:Protein kinase domain-containing protein n=1 Tax=Phytophthora rubi TaxID=129364 RepID=A0A6A3JAC3_9STRA|nr:hypothetical protein PR002_g22318 [Phytophthora rubi]KAE8990657.1 hypothetical protein PR001_g21432 [Phytophthora rubi]KAE9300086.1 hypothetical protein PR003_g22829 [Phytophthora rubi]